MADKIEIRMRDTQERIRSFAGFSFSSEIDGASNGFSFSTPFEPIPESIKRFRPYSPGVIEIFYGKTQILRGYFEKISAESSGGSRSITVEGRSGSGGIVEWSAGASVDKNQFEFSGVTANELCSQIADKHRVKFVPDTPPLEDVAIEPGQSIHEVLSNIAGANGYFAVPGTPGSADLTFRNNLGKTKPVAKITEGEKNVISFSSSYDVTKRFWQYRVFSAETGTPKISASVTDFSLSPDIRGVKVVTPKQQSADYSRASAMAKSRAMIQSFSITVSLSSFAHSGGLWKIGDVILVEAPGVMIYEKTPLIIRSLTFTYDEASGEEATLILASPELYTIDSPEAVKAMPVAITKKAIYKTSDVIFNQNSRTPYKESYNVATPK